MGDNEYITNINTMKDAAFEYFTVSKLPENIGGTAELTLGQMVNQKLLIDFTNDGDICDLDESYIEEEIGISKKSFIKLEQKLINRIKITQDVYNITCDVEIYYRSPKGRNNYSKRHIFSYYELVDIYNNWLNGKKYEVTSKIERQIMNEDIRYNVLKRDNFTCVLCGATARDGAKLQVDHIIPVSKGGKTVMSNLQTLCEKCNKGKNNKINAEDICPVCGGALIEKKGKYGVFIGCSNYPKCHYTKEK